MNCPHHIQIYKAEPRSYRDLPVRLAEFGTVYRFEQTGELSGMTRVRGFTQDDAHLFITPEQVEAEFGANIELVLFVLTSLGLNDYRVRVGLRDPNSDKYVGERRGLGQGRADACSTLVKSLRHELQRRAGRGGVLRPEDRLRRPRLHRPRMAARHRAARLQPAGALRAGVHRRRQQPHRPVMIHGAPFGSMERFMGILIEHFAGAFPLWLAPEQVRVLPISEKFSEYGQQGRERSCAARGFRVTGDYRPEKIGSKIREAQLEKIPYMLVVGDKEQTAGTVAVRDRVDGDLGAMSVAELLERLVDEVKERRIRQVSTASAGLADRGAQFAD